MRSTNRDLLSGRDCGGEVHGKDGGVLIVTTVEETLLDASQHANFSLTYFSCNPRLLPPSIKLDCPPQDPTRGVN